MRFFPVIAVLAAASAVGGCLSVTVKDDEVRRWIVDPGAFPAPGSVAATNEPARVTRLGRVRVAAPWDGENLIIRRADGSIAVDHADLFAARPAALLEAAAMPVAAAAFAEVVAFDSAAASDDELEITVSEFALDCTGPVREASVSLSAALVRSPGRRITPCANGAARVDATDGNYSAAFGAAFRKALETALSALPR